MKNIIIISIILLTFNTSANAATAILEVPDAVIVDCFADIDFLTKLRYLKVIEKRHIV